MGDELILVIFGSQGQHRVVDIVVRLPIGQRDTMSRPISQSANQPISQSANQPISQPRSASQRASRWDPLDPSDPSDPSDLAVGGVWRSVPVPNHKPLADRSDCAPLTYQATLRAKSHAFIAIMTPRRLALRINSAGRFRRLESAGSIPQADSAGQLHRNQLHRSLPQSTSTEHFHRSCPQVTFTDQQQGMRAPVCRHCRVYCRQ